MLSSGVLVHEALQIDYHCAAGRYSDQLLTALETENTPLADMRLAAQAARRIAVDVVPVIADVMHNLTRLERQSFSGENVQNSEESPRVTARKN